MRPIRYVSRSLLVVTIALAVICQFVPLLEVLGYEYAALAAVLVSLLGGSLAIIRVNSAKRSSHDFWVPWLSGVVQGLVLLAIFLLISLVNTYFVHQCRVASGLFLFTFIPLPALIHFSAVGLLLGRFFNRKLFGFTVLFIYVGVTFVHSGYQFWWGQQVPTNLIVGFINASGYGGFSDKLFWHPSFVNFRLLMMVLSMGLIALTLALTRPNRRYVRIVSYVTILLALVVSLLAGLNMDKWGIGSGRSRIMQETPAVYETNHIILHYSPSSEMSHRIAAIADDYEWLFHQLSSTLNQSPGWKLQSFIYPDGDRMQQATGADGYIFTQPWHREIHIPFDNAQQTVPLDTLKHEMTHILMGDFAGSMLRVNLSRGILEGSAVAIADDLYRGPEFQGKAAAAAKTGHLTSATVLFSRTGFGFGAASINKSYTLAGSFIGFLIERYGITRFESLYSSSDFAGVYDKSLAQLDSEWQAYLKTVPVDEREVKQLAYLYDDTVFRPLFKNSCPRIGPRTPDPAVRVKTLINQRQFDQAIILCNEVYSGDDHDPDWLIKEADIYREQGRPFDAIATLDRAMQLPHLPHTMLEQIVSMSFDLLTQNQEWDRAAQILALADRMDVISADWREIRRRALATPVAIRSLIFTGMSGAGRRVQSSLKEAIRQAPDFGLSYLFLARALDNRGDSQHSAAALYRQFIELTDGLSATKVAVLLKLGRADYEGSAWAVARQDFTQARELAPRAQSRQSALDWLARLDWRMRSQTAKS